MGFDDGVRERGLDELEPEAVSIAKASYFGRGAPDDGAGLAPSLRAGSEGFKGAEEFQRSVKESTMSGVTRVVFVFSRNAAVEY